MAYITCKHCGCQMSDKSEACPVCGASVVEDATQKEDTNTNLNDNIEETTPSETKPKHRNWLLWIGIAFVAMIAIAATVIIVNNNKEKQAAEQLRIKHQLVAEQMKLQEQKRIEEQKRVEEEKQREAKEIESIKLGIKNQVVTAFTTCSIEDQLTNDFKRVLGATREKMREGHVAPFMDEFSLDCADEAKVTALDLIDKKKAKVTVELLEWFDEDACAKWNTTLIMVCDNYSNKWNIDDVLSGNYSYKNAMIGFVNSNNYRSSTKYVVIDGSGLRLRLGPSTNADTFKWPDGTNRHPKVGDKFLYLGESGDFYQIDFNGTTLWVSKGYTHIE